MLLWQYASVLFASNHACLVATFITIHNHNTVILFITLLFMDTFAIGYRLHTQLLSQNTEHNESATGSKTQTVKKGEKKGKNGKKQHTMRTHECAQTKSFYSSCFISFTIVVLYLQRLMIVLWHIPCIDRLYCKNPL